MPYRSGIELGQEIREHSTRLIINPVPRSMTLGSIAVPEKPNLIWLMDFMADRLEGGRQFRLLNVLDHFNPKGWASRWIYRFLPSVPHHRSSVQCVQLERLSATYVASEGVTTDQLNFGNA